MSSLIANEVKTNMCSITVKFFIVLTTFVYCSHLTDTTLITTITDCSTQLFVILLTTATLCSYATCHKTASITTELLIALSCPFILLEKSTATVCICAFSHMSFPHAYCCCFRCSIYLVVCICVRSLMLHLCYPSLSYSYGCYNCFIY